MSTLHQPSVGDEVTDLREAVDVVDFVKDHQGEDFACSGDTSKQGNDFLGVDLVVFHLTAVYCFHVQGVVQNELDAGAVAQICHPIPGKDALDGQDRSSR